MENEKLLLSGRTPVGPMTISMKIWTNRPDNQASSGNEMMRVEAIGFIGEIQMARIEQHMLIDPRLITSPQLLLEAASDFYFSTYELIAEVVGKTVENCLKVMEAGAILAQGPDEGLSLKWEWER